MTIAQQNQRLLSLVIFFVILATILLAVLWFEGSQLMNFFWHTIHGIAIAGPDAVSRHP
jgi:sugar phosphate permease